MAVTDEELLRLEQKLVEKPDGYHKLTPAERKMFLLRTSTADMTLEKSAEACGIVVGTAKERWKSIRRKIPQLGAMTAAGPEQLAGMLASGRADKEELVKRLDRSLMLTLDSLSKDRKAIQDTTPKDKAYIIKMLVEKRADLLGEANIRITHEDRRQLPQVLSAIHQELSRRKNMRPGDDAIDVTPGKG